ncbi:Uncharacterised protein [Bordetella pertussis]|nr:Uncharacterised protein [Bordetella pertussis]
MAGAFVEQRQDHQLQVVGRKLAAAPPVGAVAAGAVAASVPSPGMAAAAAAVRGHGKDVKWMHRVTYIVRYMSYDISTAAELSSSV